MLLLLAEYLQQVLQRAGVFQYLTCWHSCSPRCPLSLAGALDDPCRRIARSGQAIFYNDGPQIA